MRRGVFRREMELFVFVGVMDESSAWLIYDGVGVRKFAVVGTNDWGEEGVICVE